MKPCLLPPLEFVRLSTTQVTFTDVPALDFIENASDLCPRQDWGHSYDENRLSGWEIFGIAGKTEMAHHDNRGFQKRGVNGFPNVEIPVSEQYTVMIYAYRDPSVGFLNYIFPVMATTLLNFVGYCTLPDDVSGRLGLNVTLALTLTAFKSAISGQLPTDGYLTDLDIFMGEQFGIVIVAGICFGVAGILERNFERGREFDFFFGAGLFFLFLCSTWRLYDKLQKAVALSHMGPDEHMQRTNKRLENDAKIRGEKSTSKPGESYRELSLQIMRNPPIREESKVANA